MAKWKEAFRGQWLLGKLLLFSIVPFSSSFNLTFSSQEKTLNCTFSGCLHDVASLGHVCKLDGNFKYGHWTECRPFMKQMVPKLIKSFFNLLQTFIWTLQWNHPNITCKLLYRLCVTHTLYKHVRREILQLHNLPKALWWKREDVHVLRELI